MVSSFAEIWSRIEAYAGEKFYQIRGGEFTYVIQGDYLIPDRSRYPIPIKHFEEATSLLPISSTVTVQHLRGPSYIYAILMDKRILKFTPPFKSKVHDTRAKNFSLLSPSVGKSANFSFQKILLFSESMLFPPQNNGVRSCNPTLFFSRGEGPSSLPP